MDTSYPANNSQPVLTLVNSKGSYFTHNLTQPQMPEMLRMTQNAIKKGNDSSKNSKLNTGKLSQFGSSAKDQYNRTQTYNTAETSGLMQSAASFTPGVHGKFPPSIF